jgi:putative ABC transport system permease protein
VIRLILAGLRQRKLRAALTATAILLGVAMVTGTLVLTSQITRAFDEIFQAANSGVDVRVTPRTDFEGGFGAIPTLPASMVADVERVEGVASAAGEVAALGSPVIDGRYVQSTGAPSFVFSLSPDPFRATDIATGRYPSRSGEVAVNEALADSEGLEVGDRLGIATRDGVKPVTLTGTVTFANVSSIGGATIVLAPIGDVQRWFNQEGRINTIAVEARAGVSPDALARRIAATLPAKQVEVRTGEQDAADQAQQTTEAINTFLRPALLAFGVIALFVGAFIIFNTFSITVAQRLRELGLLRTIGASRRQVMASVVGEAFIIGLVAGVVGLFAGYGFAALLVWVFDTLLPGGIPVATAELSVGIAVTALLVGVVVSVVAALIPALRASRVPPVAALREGAEIPKSRFSRFAPVFAGALAIGGVVLIILGLRSEGPATQRLLVMALGALLVFLAIGGLSRYLVPPLARVIGWPLERLPGASGSLARRNATRNPARTAATASALMIGIGLVAFVAVFAQGLKASVTDAIDGTLRGDLIISGKSFQPVPAGVTAAVVATPGIDAAVAVLIDESRIVGAGRATAYGLNPRSAGSSLSLQWINGDQTTLASLGPTTAVVEQEFAQAAGITVGESIRARSSTGRTAAYRVTGIYKDQILFNQGFITSDAGFARIFTARDPVFILATVDPGTDPVAAKDAVAKALAPFPVAEVRTNAEYRDEISSRVDSILYLLYVLLAMSVVISLFGIVNTLVLSITERTREIGMLRAIGLTRSQLRRMVRYESTITSGIGGIIGIVLGVVLAWIFSLGLRDEGIVFRIPWLQLVIFLAVAIIAGVLAAVLPARRAAKLDPLDALHYE